MSAPLSASQLELFDRYLRLEINDERDFEPAKESLKSLIEPKKHKINPKFNQYVKDIQEMVFDLSWEKKNGHWMRNSKTKDIENFLFNRVAQKIEELDVVKSRFLKANEEKPFKDKEKTLSMFFEDFLPVENMEDFEGIVKALKSIKDPASYPNLSNHQQKFINSIREVVKNPEMLREKLGEFNEALLEQLANNINNLENPTFRHDFIKKIEERDEHDRLLQERLETSARDWEENGSKQYEQSERIRKEKQWKGLCVRLDLRSLESIVILNEFDAYISKIESNTENLILPKKNILDIAYRLIQVILDNEKKLTKNLSYEGFQKIAPYLTAISVWASDDEIVEFLKLINSKVNANDIHSFKRCTTDRVRDLWKKTE